MKPRSQAPRVEPLIAIPHDLFNEQVVLAAALTSDDARRRLVRRATAELFHTKQHPSIWRALVELDRRGLQYSHEAMRQLGGESIDLVYLSTLTQAHPEPPPNLNHHLRMLEWDHARSVAVAGPIDRLLRGLQDPTNHPDKIRGLARSVGDAFDGHGSGDFVEPAEQVVEEQMSKIRQRRTSGVPTFTTGISTFDHYEDGTPRLVPGFEPGLITALTGVSGSAKTTIVNQMVVGLARQRKRVLMGAWEQGPGKALELMAVQALGWPRLKVMLGQLTEEEEAILQDKMVKISAWVRFWRMPVDIGGGDWTNDDVMRRIYSNLFDAAPDVAVFDLFERALSDARPEKERKALYQIQGFAKQLQAHLILIQQQRLKDVESRDDKRPTREGIFGSAAWVEVPDNIIGVHNPGLFKPIDGPKVIELIILKQRDAPWPLAVEFDWRPDLGTIDNGRSITYQIASKQDGYGPPNAFMDRDSKW